MLSRVLQEWVLKRLYRFVLKPVLGKLLDSELDLAQLDVQFLNGTVELRDLLLNKEYISGLLGKYGFKLLEGSIDCARAEIPYYALSTSQILVSVEEVYLKIQPCDPIQAESSEEAYEDAGSESDANTEEVWESSDEEDGSSNQKSMIRSSIEMIAGSLEDFLEKLKIDCRTVSIELTSKEGSPSCSTKLSLSLKELSYETKTEDHGEDTGVSSAERVSRQISFNGLSLMLSSEDAADASASDDEFHDALGSPCSISAESNVKSNVLLLGNPSGDGLSGLVTIREIKDGTGLAEKIHTSIDVQVCSPTVYINRDSIREC
eukprot:CAMPEP_0197479060 /NCGR_PEP_ID=MMETSP1309-20131121/31295_1 /TAXON_ID=464262 /ORGANISM="Genus nov. species nov., Strain RCC998" /LENGTH=318 /DNA_ID=CAMNT_0043020631 /DNA_START=353 /DNA_END=1306 /DNA_ORIENTATION=+